MATNGMTTDAPKVVVIGSGSGGLLTAQALQMRGINVTVYEQDSSLEARPRDWNFGIYWAQVPLHECLPKHLQDEILDAQVDDHRAGEDELMPIINGESGELMKAMPIPFNIRLQRRRFLRVISRGLDIHYDKKLKSVSSDRTTATATFEDGTTATGSLLVGAEGAHSVVREFLLGKEKSAITYLPLVASASMAAIPASSVATFKTFANRLLVAFHPAGYFNWFGIHDALDGKQPGEWIFMMLMSWIPEDPNYEVATCQGGKILEDLKRRAEVFCPGFQEIWHSVSDDTKCWHNRLSYWAPPTEGWESYNGTVTMVGDAAHPMTFHRGQGLNNAILDAALIAQKIEKHGLNAEAINAYQEEMIPRAREAVLTSLENSMSIHDWSKLMESPLFKMGLRQK